MAGSPVRVAGPNRSTALRATLAAVLALTLQVAEAPPAHAGPSFVSELHSTSARTELFHPWGVVADNLGNIYVADSGRHRVVKYDPEGIPLLIFGTGGPSGEEGELYYPESLAFGNDRIYVTDTVNNRIQVFSTAGEYLGGWGQSGSADGDLSEPNGIAVSPDGEVFVTEGRNHRVSVFSGGGRFLRKWGSYGTGPDQFQKPAGIAFIPQSNLLLVADSYGHRIMKFHNGGGEALEIFGSHGGGDGQLAFPDDLAVETDYPNIGDDGNVYVADSDNHRVVVFRPNGSQYEFDRNIKSGAAALVSPHGVAVSSTNELFVVNTNESQVYRYVNRAPKLRVDNVTDRSDVRRREVLAFNVGYNQVDQTCRILGRIAVTVPGSTRREFTVEEAHKVTANLERFVVHLSDRQVRWIDKAWDADRKITMDGVFSGRCTDGGRVRDADTWRR